MHYFCTIYRKSLLHLKKMPFCEVCGNQGHPPEFHDHILKISWIIETLLADAIHSQLPILTWAPRESAESFLNNWTASRIRKSLLLSWFSAGVSADFAVDFAERWLRANLEHDIQKAKRKHLASPEQKLQAGAIKPLAGQKPYHSAISTVSAKN